MKHATFTFAVAWLAICASGDVPGSFEPLTVPWRDDNKFQPTGRRHYWCDKELNSLRLRRHLDTVEGHTVSVVFGKCRHANCINKVSLPMVLWNETSAQLIGGFLVETWEEVARRGKFHWETEVAVVDTFDSRKGETVDEWYQWAADNYDVVADWVVMSPERARKRLRFGYPFLENHLYLVGKVRTRRPSMIELLLAWSKPFTPTLWAAIGVGFVTTALAYRILEEGRVDVPQEKVDKGTSLGHTLFLTVANFTGGGASYTPKTGPGQVFSITYTFAVLLTVSAYTANLTSVMVEKAKVATSVDSIEEVVEKGLPICVVTGSYMNNLLQSWYPTIRLLLVETYVEAYRSVRQGHCVATVLTELVWEASRGRSKYNPDCDLAPIGEPFKLVFASFASRADAAQNCTDIVMDFVSILLQEMSLDGWLAEAKARLFQRVQDPSPCADPRRREEGDALALEDMSGVFIIHLISMIMCLAFHYCRGFFRTRRRAKVSPLEDAKSGLLDSSSSSDD